jgi:tetratricopeptide (TPR) repeat protein
VLRKKTNGLLIAALVLFVVFNMTGCEKLKVSNLKANYHFNSANSLYKDQKYRQAIPEYEAALKANPKMVQAYRYLGESYNQLYKPGVDTPQNKDYENKAINALKKAYAIDPNRKEIILSLAEMYRKINMLQEAESLYLKILSLEPANVMNYYVMAEFYKAIRSNDRPEIAKKVDAMYLRRIELDPESMDGYSRYAYYLENQKGGGPEDVLANIDKGMEFRDITIRIDPKDPGTWTAKGIDYWAKAYRFPAMFNLEQKLQFAWDGIKTLDKAIELDPNYAVPYSWKSVIFQSVLAKLEPEKAERYNAEGKRHSEKFQELNKRAAERKQLEEDLKKPK